MIERVTFIFLCATFALFARPCDCHQALHLEVTPASNCKDELMSQNVSCVLDASLSSIDKVTSLTILASRLYGGDGEFDPIVTIDLWTQGPQALNGITTSEVNFAGKIGTAGETTSQLSFSWKSPRNPRNRKIKRYECVANGLDKSRRVVSISVTRGLDTSGSGFDQSLEINLLEGIFNTTMDLEGKLESVDAKVDVLHPIIQSLQETVRTQDLTIAKIYRSLYVMSNFDSSNYFTGKRYYISKYVAAFNNAEADAKCAIIGGHLVEIGKREEYDFVFAFATHVRGTDHFFTGANDIDREDHWTFLHSKRPVSFFNWAAKQPDDGGLTHPSEDCMEINVRLQGLTTCLAILGASLFAKLKFEILLRAREIIRKAMFWRIKDLIFLKSSI